MTQSPFSSAIIQNMNFDLPFFKHPVQYQGALDWWRNLTGPEVPVFNITALKRKSKYEEKQNIEYSCLYSCIVLCFSSQEDWQIPGDHSGQIEKRIDWFTLNQFLREHNISKISCILYRLIFPLPSPFGMVKKFL